MITAVDGFKRLTDHLLKMENFFRPEPVKTIAFEWEDKEFLKKLRAKIKAGGEKIFQTYPQYPYKEKYFEPLLSDDLDDIIWKLADQVHAEAMSRSIDPTVYATLTLLANAAIQPGEPDLAQDVQSVQSIVTEMFSSFLTSRKNLGVNATALDHRFPPLVGFIGHLPGRVRFYPALRIPLPCAIELEQLRQSYMLGPVIGGRFGVGTIGLSAGYRTHPLMWGILGHELGGHYCSTADKDDRLVTEIQDKLFSFLQRKYDGETLEVVAPLWRFWAAEAVADVLGVLHLGPQYAIGAMAFFTALLRLAGYKTTSLLSQQYTNNVWDMHPIPCLIPHLIIGAIRSLPKLDDQRKKDSIHLIEQIAKTYSSGNDVVVFPEYSQVWHPRDEREPPVDLPLALPLKRMQVIAREVGEYIATVQLDELNNHSLRDLDFAWDNNDEQLALAAQDKLIENASWDFTLDGTKVSNRQLLAGGLLAVMQNDKLYDSVSTKLRHAFASTTAATE